MTPAAEIAVEVCNRSSARKKDIIFVGDGDPFCGSRLDKRTNDIDDVLRLRLDANTRVNTIFLGKDRTGLRYFRKLAQNHRGSFAQVEQ